MQGVLPRLEAEDQIVMHKDPQFARKHFDELVRRNPDLRIELQGDGRIIVMAPAGGESEYESTEVAVQLGTWAKKDGRGKVFGSNLGCNLPDGSTLSPDAAWIANELLDVLPRSTRRLIRKRFSMKILRSLGGMTLCAIRISSVSATN